MTTLHPAMRLTTKADDERSRRFPQQCVFCGVSILQKELRAWGELGPLFCEDCHEYRRAYKLNPNDAKFEELYLHRPSQLAPAHVRMLVKWIYDIGYPYDLPVLEAKLIPEFAIPCLAELLVSEGGWPTLEEATEFIREEGVR